jgi:protein MpaA
VTTDDCLKHHRAHDYPRLIERWRAVAKRAGLSMKPIAKAAQFRLYCVRTKRLPAEGAIYISAGIHGDEPAATEGLVTWAEKNVALLRRRPFFIIPCINPWGLKNNSRVDSKGRDLNRRFHDDSVTEIAALKRAVGDRRFSMVLTLHEDYDAQGIYIYELEGARPYWGEALIEAARPFVPADPRPKVEGRKNSGGVVRRKLDMKFFEKIGYPEAVHMFLQGCCRVYTIETPSEYGLDRRVNAHVAVIEECVRRTIMERT